MTEPSRRPRWPGADLPGRRIFVAAPLSDAAEAEVARLVDQVRAAGVPGRGRDVRWVRLDSLHLTVRFLGPTLEDRIKPAREAVRAAAAEAKPFEVTIGRAGAFPNEARPRALWLDLLAGGPALAGLAATLDRALEAVGWPPETKPFRPHLTLARADGVPAASRIAAHLIEAASELRIESAIDQIGLFESLTGDGPARYEPIELVKLG